MTKRFALIAVAATSLISLSSSLAAQGAIQSDVPAYLWDKYHRIGEKELAKGHLKEAEQMFKEELEIATGLGEKSPRLAQSLNDLGSVCESRKDYAEAEKYFKGALGLRQRLSGVDSPDLAPGMSKLIHVFLAQSKFDDAE